MNADGSGVQRISFGDGRYGGARVWSPRGDLIAFTNIYQGRFRIGVIRPDGTGERLLTEAYHVRRPHLGPRNGGADVLHREPGGAGNTAQLRAIDLTGQHGWAVPTPGRRLGPGLVALRFRERSMPRRCGTVGRRLPPRALDALGAA